MRKHPKIKIHMPTEDRQNTLPKRVAKTLDYDTGFALGVAAMQDHGMWLRPLMADANVLTKRYDSYAVAGLLMQMAEPGIRGLVEGAAYFRETEDEDAPAVDILRGCAGIELAQGTIYRDSRTAKLMAEFGMTMFNRVPPSKADELFNRAFDLLTELAAQMPGVTISRYTPEATAAGALPEPVAAN
jgi:hypothetical protein